MGGGHSDCLLCLEGGLLRGIVKIWPYDVNRKQAVSSCKIDGFCWFLCFAMRRFLKIPQLTHEIVQESSIF